jgi:hypothetical protein
MVNSGFCSISESKFSNKISQNLTNDISFDATWPDDYNSVNSFSLNS